MRVDVGLVSHLDRICAHCLTPLPTPPGSPSRRRQSRPKPLGGSSTSSSDKSKSAYHIGEERFLAPAFADQKGSGSSSIRGRAWRSLVLRQIGDALRRG